MKNKLIIFEGIDGVGKTTLCRELKKELKTRGVEAVFYEDFERKNYGFNILKPFIKKMAELSVDSSFLFYLSSAVYKSAVIEKLLERQWVICDRYVYSTIAYHKIRGCSKNILRAVGAFPIREPDYGFFVTVDDDKRLSRVKGRKNITAADTIPNKKGTHPRRMENEFKKFPLIRISNNTQLSVAINKIINNIFSFS